MHQRYRGRASFRAYSSAAASHEASVLHLVGVKFQFNTDSSNLLTRSGFVFGVQEKRSRSTKAGQAATEYQTGTVQVINGGCSHVICS